MNKKLPPNFEVWCENEICPVQGMKKGERILTIQAHPELTADILRKAVELKEEELPEDVAKEGLPTFQRPLDDELFSLWLYNFFS